MIAGEERPAGASLTCGELLRRYRLLAGFTQERLADRAGYSADYVGKLERGRRRPPAAAVTRIAEVLGLGDPERRELIVACERPVGRWPLPEALRPVPRVAFVGRLTGRRLLEHVRGAARSGARQVVLLSGEPGIGKTRLASYAALGANADGFAVCWGACSEDLAAPYEPWIDVCSQLVDHMDGDVLAEYVGRFGGEIGRLAGNLRQRLPDPPAPQSSDRETERFLLFKAVAELLRIVAGSTPLCVVLDDFHWADGQSLSLLKHVAHTVERGSLMLLVTYRDSELTNDHEMTGMLADLRRIEGVERIALDGLRADEVAELVSAAAGHQLDANALALAGELATETGGNPFFVGEILRSLIESGAITFDAEGGRWSVDLAAVSSSPESVREVIERRINRLGEEGRQALTVAAVIGRSFDIRLLTESVEMPEGRLLDQLEAAVSATLLRESADQLGIFTFEHALINHTLYQGLGRTRRARLHHRVALAIEALYSADSAEQLADLAMHWRLAAVSGKTTKAAAFSIRAGRRALDGLAPSEARALFSDALELLGPRETVDRCEALIGLGEAQRLTGDAAYRKTLLNAARIASELQDGERAARAALASSRGQTSAFGQVDEERVAAIERALELDDDPHRRARLLSLQAIELLYEHDHHHRRELAQQALTLARELGNPHSTARVLTDWYRVFQAPDGLQQRHAHLDELRTAVQASGDPRTAFFAAAMERNAMAESGQLQHAESSSQRMAAIADELDEPDLRWVAAYSAGGCMALVRGDLAEAERYAEAGLRISKQAAEPDAVMIYGGQITVVRVLQNRGSEVLELIRQGAQANPLMPAWRAGLAWLLCWLGRGEDAAAIVAEAAADRFEHVPWEQTRTAALAMYADAAAQAGVTNAAAVLYELIEPWADQVAANGVNCYGHLSTYLALLAAALGRDQQADEYFARAIDIQEQEGMLVWAARAHLGWAEALAARGEGERAREKAAHTLALAREHGYGAFEARAAAVLAEPIATGS